MLQLANNWQQSSQSQKAFAGANGIKLFNCLPYTSRQVFCYMIQNQFFALT